jgi:N-acetylglucosamine kinase-like BadF-type ATPase
MHESGAEPTDGGIPVMPSLLAVDGGASKTEAVLVADDGTVLGWARGPATNHQMVGLETAMDNLEATVAAAASDAGLPSLPSPGSPDRRAVAPLGVYCLAGIDLPVDDVRVGDAVRERGWTPDSRIDNDTLAILRAGSSTGTGVGVVCGTGLNCVARGPGGDVVRFPALGELSGDFAAGGVWLGIRGLGLALRADDGRGATTSLRDLVPRHFGLAEPMEVLDAVYRGELSFGRLAELAEVVLRAAADGDAPSAGAVDVLVDETVAMATAALARSGIGAGAGGQVEIVAGGGLFADGRFAGLVLDRIRRRVPGAVLRPISAPPVLGAALLGLDVIGAGPSAQAALAASLPAARDERRS